MSWRDTNETQKDDRTKSDKMNLVSLCKKCNHYIITFDGELFHIRKRYLKDTEHPIFNGFTLERVCKFGKKGKRCNCNNPEEII